MEGLAYTYSYLACETDATSEVSLQPRRLATLLSFAIAFGFGSGARADELSPTCNCTASDSASVTPASTQKLDVQKVGSSGLSIVELQNTLKRLGYFPTDVRATGYYGSITQESVRRFQEAYGLDADGTVGGKTLEKLNELAQMQPAAAAEISSRRGATMPRSSDPAPKPIHPNLDAEVDRPTNSEPVPDRRSSMGSFKPGDLGSSVTQAKQRLNQFGYTAGTGHIFDTQMTVALKRFQEDKGLKTDGFLGPKTEQILYAFERGLPELKQGDTGNLVQLVQFQLQMVPTGDFDEVTQANVKVFQTTQGLPVTGVVDAKTHQALGTHRARLTLAALR
jgi:peptidoglycan hydrolase-like protein with peptidoglycan-binding domain